MSRIYTDKKFDNFKKDLDKLLQKHYPNSQSNDYEWEYYNEDWDDVLSTDVNAKWRLVKLYLDLKDNENNSDKRTAMYYDNDGKNI